MMKMELRTLPLLASPLEGEGVKDLEYSPPPYPPPRGERVNILKLKRNSLPLDGGGRGCFMGIFHTFAESGGWGEYEGP
jgi:hypothetical protein